MTSQLRNGSGSSSSSLNSIFLETEDDQTIASILTEDENLRAENNLGKRLSHLDSIPHTPRVSGQIPDVNDATADHERLSERLVTYGLAELQMEGDGNCQVFSFMGNFYMPPYSFPVIWYFCYMFLFLNICKILLDSFEL
uniref:OTU domain-containing protein n=1 Tax=Glycine max TaxID=3847 RepID=C6T3R0_SOYBN|nr:unknown [Glycine max]